MENMYMQVLVFKFWQILWHSAFLEACALCSNPTHSVSNCLMASEYPEFVQEEVNFAQGFPSRGMIHLVQH